MSVELSEYQSHIKKQKRAFTLKCHGFIVVNSIISDYLFMLVKVFYVCHILLLYKLLIIKTVIRKMRNIC